MSLQLACRLPADADASSWPIGLLADAPVDGLPDCDLTSLPDRLRGVSFGQVVDAVERTGANAGRRAAIQLYQAWIASQPDSPQLFAAWFNLGVELAKAGDRPNAIAAYRNSLALRPDFYSAAVNLGLALEALGQADAALVTWRQALQTDEARITLLNQRARLLEQLGRLDEAEQNLRASLLTSPHQPDAIQHWVHLRQKLCRWPVLTSEIPGLSPADLMRHAGPLAALALTDDVAGQLAVGEAWIARKTVTVAQPLAPPDGYRHDRIRIGYLSSDFCRHAMSFLIAELLERHDRTKFEVYGYCSSPDDGSDVRRRIVAAFDRFVVIRDLSDEAAARRIRDDEIDLLVDLNGLTSGARLQVLRWKPAPVQATYLGFVGPVPLPELDYNLCDDIVIPPAFAASYQPRPLAVARTYQANDGKRAIGRAISRAEAGLPDDRFVFCCFSNHYKITEPMFGAWMAILRRAPEAVLWLIADNEWSCQAITARAASLGVDPGRLLFAGRVAPADYMVRLGLANLFLDTFPYNAGTVASDAIRMRLPVLTLAGRSFASRMAMSLLTAVGASRGVTTSLDDYVETAVSLATDPVEFCSYKALFQHETWDRTIGDAKRFVADYEAALAGVIAQS